MILLDTSVLIEMFRVKDKMTTFFYRLSINNNDFAISILTHYEIYRGSNNVQNTFWTNFLKNIKVLPFFIFLIKKSPSHKQIDSKMQIKNICN